MRRLKAAAPISRCRAKPKRLHLTSLGALIDTEGTWSTTPDHVDLEQWRHLATLGRDHYVRVMYAGYLWPFGHAASLIKVTERKFESLGPSTCTTRRTPAPALLHRRSRAGANVYRRTPHVRGPELSVYAHRAADARHARSERAGQRRQRQETCQRCMPAASRRACCSGRWCLREAAHSLMCPSRFAPQISRARRRRSRCRCCSSARSPSSNASKEVADAYNAALTGEAQRLDRRCCRHLCARRIRQTRATRACRRER